LRSVVPCAAAPLGNSVTRNALDTITCRGSDPTPEEIPMKSITRLVTTVVAVMFAVATLCPAQDVKPTDLGNAAAFHGKKIEMKDNGEVAYLLSFTAGREIEATTDGLKNTDVHLFVYDSSAAEVAKDDSSGPKCSVKVTPTQDGQYKFVIKNAGGANTVTFNVKVAK
jgi:hypothetical protein